MPIGFILTDSAFTLVWIGGKTAPIRTTNLLRVPRWESKRDAERAAKALRISGFKLRATPVSLPSR